MYLEQHPEEPKWWRDEDCLFGDFESVELTLETDGTAPGDAMLDSLSGIKADLDQFVRAAAALILDNYSYEHFAKIGVDVTLLVDETVDDIARVAKLTSIWVNDIENRTFDLSFIVPWDNHHTFDVEFENGKAVTCSVNG